MLQSKPTKGIIKFKYKQLENDNLISGSSKPEDFIKISTLRIVTVGFKNSNIKIKI